MHSFQNFIVRLIPNHPPPLETRIWKLVVRALCCGHPTIKLVHVCVLICISIFEYHGSYVKIFPSNGTAWCDFFSGVWYCMKEINCTQGI